MSDLNLRPDACAFVTLLLTLLALHARYWRGNDVRQDTFLIGGIGNGIVVLALGFVTDSNFSLRRKLLMYWPSSFALSWTLSYGSHTHFGLDRFPKDSSKLRKPEVGVDYYHLNHRR